MQLIPIDYQKLNSKQKEIYNFQKVAAKLAAAKPNQVTRMWLETLRNIDSVLQVLADATQAPVGSESVTHGHWLILQELAPTARQEAAPLDRDGAGTR